MNATITDKSTFSGRMSWSKQFLPAQYKIIEHFAPRLDFSKAANHINICEATEDDDKNFETDVYVCNYNKLNIALRVREGKSTDYGDIMIRSKTKYGSPSELDKIMQGYGDYYLYCWTDPNSDSFTINEYLFIDLDAFRVHMNDVFLGVKAFPYEGTASARFSIDLLVKRACCIACYLEP